MKLAVKKLLKQYDRNIQKQVAEILLGVAKGKNEGNNIEGKMTSEMLAEFCTWWDSNKIDRQSDKPLTRPYRVASVKNHVQAWLDDVVAKRKNTPPVAHKRPSATPVAESSVSSEYRASYGLVDVSEAEVPAFMLNENGVKEHD